MRVRVVSKVVMRLRGSRGPDARWRRDAGFPSSERLAVPFSLGNTVRFPESQRIPTPCPTKLSPFPWTSPAIPMEEMP